MLRLSFISLLLLLPMAHAEQSEDGQVWAEAFVDVTEPYVQQTILYTLRISSTAQVKTLNPSAPMLPGVALLEKLDQQPHFYTQQAQGTTYSISEFRYALTPLTFGQSQIIPASVEVTYSSKTGWYPYAAKPPAKKISLQTNAIDLHVKPPASSSKGNWLPLLALTLEGKLDKTPTLQVGEPFSITLTTNALGITGAQLPEPQLPLKPDEFKVYAERPQFGQRLVRNNSVLQGWRVDTYTLIPKRAGTLRIPELQMHWWSLREANSAWSKWPVHLIPVQAAGQTTVPAQATSRDKSTDSVPINKVNSNFSWFWWLFSHLSLLALGWWLGAGRPAKEILYAATLQALHWLHDTGRKLAQNTAAQVRRLGWLNAYQEKLKTWQAAPKPWRKLAKNAPEAMQTATQEQATPASARSDAPDLYPQMGWRKWLWRVTPAPLRALQFLRAIDNEAEPLRLSRLIQQFAHEQFNTPLNTPLLRLSQAFAQRCPRIDAVALQRLFKELDQLHYDRPNRFKLREWKAEFQRVLQYLPLRQAKPRDDLQQRLPDLNPL